MHDAYRTETRESGIMSFRIEWLYDHEEVIGELISECLLQITAAIGEPSCPNQTHAPGYSGTLRSE